MASKLKKLELPKIDLNINDYRFIRDMLEDMETMEEVTELVFSQFKDKEIHISKENVETIFCGFMNENYDFVELKGIQSFFDKYNTHFRFIEALQPKEIYQ